MTMGCNFTNFIKNDNEIVSSYESNDEIDDDIDD